MAAGSPEQVAEKILFEHELFGHQRYIGQMSVGAVDHRDVLRSMELFGTEVAPLVRAEVARREAQRARPRRPTNASIAVGSSERVAAGDLVGAARRAGSA